MHDRETPVHKWWQSEGGQKATENPTLHDSAVAELVATRAFVAALDFDSRRRRTLREDYNTLSKRHKRVTIDGALELWGAYGKGEYPARLGIP